MIGGVNLQTCSFRLVANATLSVRGTAFGATTDKNEVVAQVQFVRPLGAWRQSPPAGQGSLAPHSVVWVGLNGDQDALMPLGYPAELFNPLDRSVGLGSGGYRLVIP